MSEVNKMICTVHEMHKDGKLSTIEYCEAYKSVKQGIIPSWLILRMRNFKKRYC